MLRVSGIMSITNETELSSAWSLGEPQKLVGEAH